MTKQDYEEIRTIIHSEMNLLRTELKGEMATKEDIANMATKEDIANMATKEDIAEIREEMNEMKEDISETIEEMKGDIHNLRKDVTRMETYMHRKFTMIETDLIPKVNTLFEMADRYVTHDECRNERGIISKDLNCITPMMSVVQSHSETLENHDERIKHIESLAF